MKNKYLYHVLCNILSVNVLNLDNVKPVFSGKELETVYNGKKGFLHFEWDEKHWQELVITSFFFFPLSFQIMI